MTEAKKESLSALIDGEAGELEVHRLVREFRSDAALAGSWAIYQHIRAMVRTGRPTLSPARHEALLNRISMAIEAEAGHERPEADSGSPRIIFGSLALAASLILAVFIGVQQPFDAPVPDMQATGANTTVTSAPGARGGLVAVSPVDIGQAGAPQTRTRAGPTAAQGPGAEATPELVELDEDKQRLLRAYLNQHDHMVRMNAAGRLVNYQQETSGTPSKQ